MAYVEKYNRRRAVNYAKRWAYERNPRYYDYSGIGGDCTNFVSQCLYAGSGVMNYTPTFGWYYINANDKSPSWTGVQYLYDFLVSNTQRGVFGVEIGLEDVSDGDVIQLYGDQKFFVETFRELTKYLQSLQTFIEFSFDHDSLIMSEQEYQDYKSKYLMLYAKQKKDREVVSVLNDVDFCIELMESDRINVAYIMNLIRNIHFDDAKQKDYDIKHIKEELGRTDNPQLLRKVEILQAFLDRVVVGLESADEIDAAYNDFENEAKREEIVAFAHTEEIDPTMLTDFISEYEFSGTMDAGNIRDRIEKPMPLLKKRSLVNRIVDFIRQHTEKFQ